MAVAQIQITQGAVVGSAGQSVIGLDPTTAITLTDDGGSGADSYLWEVVSFPGPDASAPAISNSTTQVASINPPGGGLTDGVYILRLTRTDEDDGVTSQVRFFAVGDEDGIALPSAGMNRSISNVGGSALAQVAGWFGSVAGGSNVFLDAYLRLRRKREGRFTGRSRSVSHSSGSPATDILVYGTSRPTQRLIATGTGVYTIDFSLTGAEDGATFWLHISHSTGGGNIVFRNGVGGSAITTLTAPDAGTSDVGLRFYYNGSAWLMWPVVVSEGGGGGGTVTDVTGTAPIVSSGGNTPVLSINAANGSNAGSMSAANYTLLTGATDANTVSALVRRPGTTNGTTFFGGLSLTASITSTAPNFTITGATAQLSLTATSNLELNAVTCSGSATSVTATGSKLCVRDANGDCEFRYITAQRVVAPVGAGLTIYSFNLDAFLSLPAVGSATLSSAGHCVVTSTGGNASLTAVGSVTCQSVSDATLRTTVGRLILAAPTTTSVSMGDGTTDRALWRYLTDTNSTNATTFTLGSITPTSRAATYEVTVMGTTATAEVYYTFTLRGRLRSGVAEFAGSTPPTPDFEGSAALSACQCEIDSSSGVFRVRPTGIASTTITWTLSVREVR